VKKWIHGCNHIVESERVPKHCQPSVGGCGRRGAWTELLLTSGEKLAFGKLHEELAQQLSHNLQVFLHKARTFDLWPEGNAAAAAIREAARVLHEYGDRGGEAGSP